ncbi:MAG: LPS-assembly protein LptD, partial [Rhabdaerophilum calidifontis]
EGIALSSRILLPKSFYATGSVLFDLDRYLTQRIVNPAADTSRWSVSGASVGLGYRDECTDFAIQASRSYNYSNGQDPHVTTVLMRLVLRDVGGTSISQRTNN